MSNIPNDAQPSRREEDRIEVKAAKRKAGFCAMMRGIGKAFSYAWDWVDTRDIDKHTVAMLTMYYMVYLIQWAEHFASTNVTKSGMEVAAIIAAVTAPYMAMQAVVLKFYFDFRTPVANGGSKPNGVQ